MEPAPNAQAAQVSRKKIVGYKTARQGALSVEECNKLTDGTVNAEWVQCRKGTEVTKSIFEDGSVEP